MLDKNLNVSIRIWIIAYYWSFVHVRFLGHSLVGWTSDGLLVIEGDGLADKFDEFAAQVEASPLGFEGFRSPVSSHVAVQPRRSFRPDDGKTHLDVQHGQDVGVLLQKVLLVVTTLMHKNSWLYPTFCTRIHKFAHYSAS